MCPNTGKALRNLRCGYTPISSSPFRVPLLATTPLTLMALIARGNSGYLHLETFCFMICKAGAARMSMKMFVLREGGGGEGWIYLPSSVTTLCQLTGFFCFSVHINVPTDTSTRRLVRHGAGTHETIHS